MNEGKIGKVGAAIYAIPNVDGLFIDEKEIEHFLSFSACITFHWMVSWLEDCLQHLIKTKMVILIAMSS